MCSSSVAVHVDATPEGVTGVFAGIGGQARGWPAYHWLWRVRGSWTGWSAAWACAAVAAIRTTCEGEALDFWRVEAVDPGRSILLRAEMKLPGRGWLQFETFPSGDGTAAELVQTAFFASRGLFGLLYWYGSYPLHSVIFSKMIDNTRATGRSAIDSGRSRDFGARHWQDKSPERPGRSGTPPLKLLVLRVVGLPRLASNKIFRIECHFFDRKIKVESLTVDCLDDRTGVKALEF